MEILELSNTVTKMKNSLKVFNSDIRWQKKE